ncbi:MAG TPA: PAS domain S-box protein [Burkholderiales bacterium]|nr:PAS domain S-box protein [Burkholderiales bacterium]
MEEKLREAALAVSSAEGEAFYEDLVVALASILGVEYVAIAVYTGPDRRRLKTIARFAEGRIARNFEYPIAGTPCERSMGHAFGFFPSGVCNRFPDDADLQALQPEGYAASTLTDAAGDAIGLVWLMSKRELTDSALTETVLKIFAARIGSEIERQRAAEARRTSDAQYRAMFDAASDSLVLRDAEFRIVDVNPAFLALSGSRREDVIGIARLTRLAQPEQEQNVLALHNRALAGEHVTFESVGKHIAGRTFMLEVRGVPMMHQGRPHVLYVSRDVTERRTAEARLRASEEQYRAIFNASADAMIIWDRDYRRVDVNPAFERIYGWTREEVVGRGFEIFSLAESHIAPRRELVRRALAGETCRAELAGLDKSGRAIVTEIHVVPFQHRGEPHALAIGRDVTERKAAEEHLRASEEQYRSIFNASADSLVLRDADFTVVDVNLAYEAMSGRPRAEALGRRDLTMSSPEMNAHVRGLHERALRGEQVRFESRATRKNGERFEIEVRGVPIQHRGAPHVLYIGTDVTARRTAEADRTQLEAQLRQAQRMEAIGHLTGGIAHDFNNILQGTLGNLSLAAERQHELRDAKLGKYLDRARHSAQRARELIGQMLTFSRGQHGERRAVDLPELVRDACKLLRSTLPATIDLHATLEETLPPLRLDPVQVEQVVLNLCINARDAMRGSGAIRVGVRRAAHVQGVCASCRQKVDGHYIELYVRDTGPGIPQHVMDRMFEPFFSTKAAGHGSGMGLSLAHGIVHEHGGHILVDSIQNDRTKFRVLFALPEAAAEGTVAQSSPAQPLLGARARLAGRVLVVDDEETIRDFMTDLLSGWGLDVVALPDGAAAHAAFVADPKRYDLVITDHTMPLLTGLALARELARLRPGLPVILYTGYGEDLSSVDLRDACVAQLVRKPIEPAEFFPLLAAHLPAATAAV